MGEIDSFIISNTAMSYRVDIDPDYDYEMGDVDHDSAVFYVGVTVTPIDTYGELPVSSSLWGVEYGTPEFNHYAREIAPWEIVESLKDEMLWLEKRINDAVIASGKAE